MQMNFNGQVGTVLAGNVENMTIDERPVQVWIVVDGQYEDQTIIGIATSREDADAIVMRARCQYPEGFEGSNYVYGPFEPGQLYSRMGNKL